MASPLETREVLVVDCQSTGANPRRGHLLEIAWAVASAAAGITRGGVEESLVRLPDGATIPRRVSALTGITAERMADARDPTEVWSDLARAASTVEGTWTVAHFARFEEPFLRDLHARFDAGPFPLRCVCTRDLARHLLPQLPRLGLRALAGHLGYGLPEIRSAAVHVRATVVVWQELCRLLADVGVLDLDGLTKLLETPPPKRGVAERRFPLSLEQRRALPDRPGVYRFADPNGRVLYVGKAASIRQRVASYFRPRGYRLDSTLEMLTQAFDVRATETATRLEAALLELDEIRRLDPPYNTALRERGDQRVGAAEILDRLLAVIDWPESFLEAETDSASIGLTYPEPPDVETLRAGADLFRDVFLKGAKVTRSRLAALGSVLWWEREKQEAEQNEQDEHEDEGELCWTPARVARALARGARHAAHLQRREIWHRLLADSTVRWRGRQEGDRTVVIEGCAVPDRLRVLTTELRRLAADDRLIEVRLASGVALTPERFRALLAWV